MNLIPCILGWYRPTISSFGYSKTVYTGHWLITHEPEKVNKAPQKTQRMKILFKKGNRESLLLGTGGIYFKATKLIRAVSQLKCKETKSKWFLDISLSLRDKGKKTQGPGGLSLSCIQIFMMNYLLCWNICRKYNTWLRSNIPLRFGWIVTEAEHLHKKEYLFSNLCYQLQYTRYVILHL